MGLPPATPRRSTPLKADPSAQLTLLDLQDLDSRAAQLRHQLTTLPELAELTELRRRKGELEARLVDARTQVEDLTAAQDKIETDVETVRARRVRDRDRMDQGLISNPKDLERMTHELESLERRITSLEDEELEVMAFLEDAQRTLAELTAEAEEIQTRGRAAVASRDQKTAAIDAELAAIDAERTPLGAGLPGDLVTLYDRLRESKDGVGAAALRARACGGCRLTLDPGEIARLRTVAEDEVVRCTECQRILVRTPESGL